MQKNRIAIIGSGFIGSTHAASIIRIPGIELAAIVDMNPKIGQEAANKFNCKYYQTMDEMFMDESINIVDICLPTYLHEKFVLLAAQHGKHILCEKPFALTKQACIRMAYACEKAGVKFMIAQVARWFPEYVKIEEMLSKQLMGSIHMVYSGRLAQHPNWTAWHRDPQKSGGGLFDLHVHDIDFLYHIFGKIQKVYAVGWKSPTGCWNHIITLMTFCSGISAVAEGSLEMTGNYPFSMMLRVTGDAGTIDYKFTSGFNLNNQEQDKKLVIYMTNNEPESLNISSEDPFELQLIAFIKAIENDTELPIPPTESIEVIGVIEAINKSLETGSVIEIAL